MTAEWTPEEDAVAKVIYDELEGPINDQDFGRQMRQWELSRKIARAAIATMQPRWRDVRTDPPPRDGTEFDIWNGDERVVDVFWSAKRQAWCRSEYEMNHGHVDWIIGPFSHWMVVTPPLPTEDKP